MHLAVRGARDGVDRRHVVKIFGLAAAYFVTAKIGLEFAFATESVTAVWAPTGISLAALVLGGRDLWPGVAIGAFLTNVTTGGLPLYAVLGITLGNTLEAVAGAYLILTLTDFRPSLERVRDVVALVVLGGIVSTMISATLGTASLLVANEIDGGDFGTVWRTWWLGDMCGALVVAPAVFVAASQWPFPVLKGRMLEAAGVVAATLALSIFVFTQDLNITFVLFPVLLWACLRFRQVGTVGVCLMIASIAVPFTDADKGPFAGESPDDRLLLAQTLVGVASLTGLILAALVTQRERVQASIQGIASTLQESLLPRDLPEIPGAEIGVDFRAAGEEHLVGGDFYDWFRNEDGSWMIVVGDVVGKGAPAAATTALARYTLRAAALKEPEPRRVLGTLNDAILRQSPGQLCTVVCARLELDDRGGAGITLAVAGHPAPIVLRRDGGVESIGKGTLLGLAPDPNLDDFGVELAPGDALILHTDGLTDAYAPKRIVDPDELAAVVGGLSGRRAEDIVSGIGAGLLRPYGEPPRDDIIVLAFRLPAP